MPRAFRRQAVYFNLIPNLPLANLIATQCDPTWNLSWQEVALFNFGTADPLEVKRALYEQIGCVWPAAAVTPDAVPLIPRNNAIQLHKPVLHTESGLPVDKVHSVKVKTLLPAPAVSIDTLDKWFAPGVENCDYTYSLEGILERANKLDRDIYASGYCKANLVRKGEIPSFTYTPIDHPLKHHLVVGGALLRARGQAGIWFGDSEATEGTLVRRPPAARRLVNAAHSPYSLLLRYYKDGDRTARVDLLPFWPKFLPAGGPDNNTLTIRWTVKGTTKLKWGQLIVYGQNALGAEEVIFRKPLAAGDFTPGAQRSYTWNGVNQVTGAAIAAAEQPFRVQIQAHTDQYEDAGLALAVMQTEVRLYAHQTVGTAIAPALDPQCLRFRLAPQWPEANPPAAGVKLHKYRLAQAGYHPGPIDDDVSREEFKTAVREFQRSNPATSVAPFDRLAVTGKVNGATASGLATLPANQRLLIGDVANFNALGGAAADAHLHGQANQAILWVDDRQYYTELGQPPDEPLMQMDNYRGGMEVGDRRVDLDRADLMRPWIPLMAELAVLRKVDALYPNVALPPASPEIIGPIRVDWKFDELAAADVLADVFVGANPAEKGRTRTRAFLEYVTGVNGKGVSEGGKTYINAPEKLEGAPAAVQGNNDATVDTRNGANVLRLKVDGKSVKVNLTGGAARTKPQIVTEINNALAAQGVGARARLDHDTILIETNGFGTKRSIHVRERSSPRLLTMLGLAHSTVHGTANAPATVSTNGTANIDTSPNNLLALSINGAALSISLPKEEELSASDLAAEIHKQLQGHGAKAKAQGGIVTIETLVQGVGQQITVTGGSPRLLTALGLANGQTVNGAAAAAAILQTGASPKTDTSDPSRFSLEVDGTAVEVTLPTDPALTKVVIGRRVHEALLAAGVAAKASEAGGVVTIETTGGGEKRTMKVQPTNNVAQKRLLRRLGLSPGKASGTTAVLDVGIRPGDLGEYYKKAFGFGDKDSLRPWLAYDDTATKVVCSVVHDDLGQAEADLHPPLIGEVGIFFRPSRIAGDGYRIRTEVGFDNLPDGNFHPNWPVLAKRYQKLPVAHTAKLYVWRRGSIRGHVNWTDAGAPVAPGPDVTAAMAYYHDAHVHFVNEGTLAVNQFLVPTPAVPAPPNAVMTTGIFTGIINNALNIAGSDYQGLAASLQPGYVWPYLGLQYWGIPARNEDQNAYLDFLGDLENASWDLVNEKLMIRMIGRIERLHGRLRGHTLVEFTSSPGINIEEYSCPACGWVQTALINNAVGVGGTTPLHGAGAACPACSALGIAVNPYNDPDGLPISAIGLGLGGCWLFLPRRIETWAHEVGHHRHLQHSQGNSGDDPAPGFQVAQHDSANNPGFVGASAHNLFWDRHCLMSYNKTQARRFCGKCVLRNRGWPVQVLADAPGGTQDP